MDVARYLDRINYHGPLEPDLPTLAGLQRAHLLSVPFDALDCHLGTPVTVEPADAYRKVVERRRGGFCYELNGLFAWLLEAVGFKVTRVAARPTMADGGLAPPFAHLALLVEADDRGWLVDVGFGAPWPLEPIPLDELERDGESLVARPPGSTGYRFTTEPVPQAAFADQCHRYATDPASGFVRRGPVQLMREDGYVSITVDDPDWRERAEREAGIVLEP